MNTLFTLITLAEQASKQPKDWTFGFHNFIENLPYMGIGMVIIIAVIGIIIGATALLNKISSGKK